MEFTQPQIAALVLGYLKSEKLYSVIDEFLKNCPYFTENNQNIKMGKYFVTRVSGMRLVDFLEEYAMIYSIVQGRLEETNYYETHSRTSLVDQIMFLLDKETGTVATSTPVISSSVGSEVDTTPAHTLPGNNSEENEPAITKTPKKKSTRNKSKDKEEIMDVSEVLTQTLLENHELHEKIAETINIVRNTPETGRNTTEEHVSAGAAKELDAIIKTVVQRTEEDPVYNKLIDEIIGTPPFDNQSKKSTSAHHADKSGDPMDAHTNDAVRSIIEAAQNTDPPPPEPPKPQNGGEVYLFDGTLDSYLKSSGAAPPMAPNPLYFNTGGGLLIMPPEAAPKQYYIVNNQPMINVNVPTVKNITENDIMAMPTIIVNDESCTNFTNQTIVADNPKKCTKLIKPKATTKITEAPPTFTSPSSKAASHVRNLDFSTPGSKINGKKGAKKKAWDSDLRNLVLGCVNRTPTPKKKRTVATKKNPKPKSQPSKVEKEEKPEEKEEKTEEKEEKTKEKEEKTEEKKESTTMQTPVKDTIPKTPGPVSNTNCCTPFSQVLEEQLQGVDLISMPTPKIPITPGFALTPGDLGPYNQRSTDYSTSSSYYQPSDTEQNKSLDQLIEECKRLENNKSPPPEKHTNLKILSDVVIEQAKVVTEPEKPQTTLKKFNQSVIGKKNLNLLKRHPTSSSSSDSDSDSDSPEHTVIEKTDVKETETSSINNIINEVPVKDTLDEEARKKDILTQLEIVRKRTIDKIKNPPKAARKPRTSRKTAKTPKVGRRKSVKKEAVEDAEAQKLIHGLAERGIHLVQNKSPQKVNQEECLDSPKSDSSGPNFDKKIYQDLESVVHSDKIKRKALNKYNFEILKKSMSAQVFDELDKEVTMIIKWTPFESIFELKPRAKASTPKKRLDDEDDELMDYVFLADVRDSSPEKGTKGGRKRKLKNSESEKQTEKKAKAFENNLKLLKKIDVDSFLDKVHGE
ncbi:uncharacterized protein LOC123009557 isoform X2 [Tribolium madens]|uniref:uncharacterized protein LOC123009557 isoform X2 n=1 Tax=Tribolium madens TaxID=41895 RepID=UPI001CF73C4A|nr:uncharacterized protein LOC123009557 isoform X2 [Tribolium madens]